MAQDWSMPSRGKACCGCAHEFEPGEAFNAHLYEAADGYARKDYCLRCTPPSEPPPLGYWRTQRPAPSVKKTQSLDREAVYGFFERLDSDEPGRAQFRFVLALLLWRQKVLKFDRTLEVDGEESWRFSLPKSTTVHDVRRPQLDETEIQRLSEQLESLLAGDGVELQRVVGITEGGLPTEDAVPAGAPDAAGSGGSA